jgi:hypothetical protein
MADRATKLQRLERFRRNNPHVSATALSSILNAVERDGMPEMHGRMDVARARDATIKQDTPYGQLQTELELDTKTGTKVKFRILNLFALLFVAFNSCGGFHTYMAERLQAHPSSVDNPWSLVLYTDEITPGNVLAPDNKRKIQAIYVSFMELEPHMLSREEAWFTIGTIRSKTVKSLHGGMSQLIGAILKHLFIGIVSLSATGVCLQHGNRQMVRLFARLHCIIQDGNAHKELFHCKGSSGTKFCMLCRNIVAMAAHIDADTENGDPHLKCGVCNDAELVCANDEQIIAAARRVAARAAGPSEGFDDFQQAFGFTYHKYNILVDNQLKGIIKPASQYMHDWMHTIFVHGVFNTAVFLFSVRLKDAVGLDMGPLMESYIATWTWPHRLHVAGAALSKLFSKERMKAMRTAHQFKCQASDGLNLSAILAFWVRSTIAPSGTCPLEVLAFLALCHVIELIGLVLRGGNIVNTMRKAVNDFMLAFKNAWGENYMHPKFHWMLHFAQHLEQFTTLLSCFVTERKHRAVKAYANDIKNTIMFDESILSEVTCAHLARMDDPDVFSTRVGLIQPRMPTPKLARLVYEALDIDVNIRVHVLMGRESRFNKFGTCAINDVVAMQVGTALQIGQVRFHFEVEGEPVSIISTWDDLKPDEHGSCVCKPSGRHITIETSDILETLTWKMTSNGKARVLLPKHLLHAP